MICPVCIKPMKARYYDKKRKQEVCESCIYPLEASTSPVGDSKKKRHG